MISQSALHRRYLPQQHRACGPLERAQPRGRHARNPLAVQPNCVPYAEEFRTKSLYVLAICLCKIDAPKEVLRPHLPVVLSPSARLEHSGKTSCRRQQPASFSTYRA